MHRETKTNNNLTPAATGYKRQKIMGEYAKRFHDGEVVKIGTCDEMFYCRYDQAGSVDYKDMCNDLYWRIPVPQEDGTLPGDYDQPLLADGIIPYELALKNFSEDIANVLMSSVGRLPVYIKELGMQGTIPCYHGYKVPEAEGFKFGFNGKRDAIYLNALCNKKDDLVLCIKCNACGQIWTASFSEIAPYMKSLWMKLRLLHQCTEYWHKHNDEPCTYSVIDKDKAGKPMEICNMTGEEDGWQVDVNDETVMTGTWEECRNAFIDRLDPGWCIGDKPEEEFAYFDEVRRMKQQYLQTL